MHTRFPDVELAALVGVDRVQEWPVAIVVLGEGAPAVEAAETAASGVVADDPVEFPLVTFAQRAGEQAALGSPWDRGEPIRIEGETAAPVEDVILARSSQRLFDRTGSLADRVFETSLQVGLRGVTLPHRVAVNAVDGYTPGLYRWPDLTRPVRAGDLRHELYLVSSQQGLPRDAGFVVIAAADIGSLDGSEYRDAHLAAGLVEGRLHLLAYAFGAGASGMTFYDREVSQLLGEPLDGVLITCIGVPEYAARAGGPPGAPTPIREVRTCLDDEPV